MRNIDTTKALADYDDIDEFLEARGDYVYGARRHRYVQCSMAGGGGHWWNYIVTFDDDGEFRSVEVQNHYGKREIDGKAYLVYPEGHGEYLVVMTDYEYNQLSDEIKSEMMEWCNQ